MWQKEKHEKMKEKKERREQRRKEREKLGDEVSSVCSSIDCSVTFSSFSFCPQAPPKLVPRTIENTRILDETVVLPDDEEVVQDEKTDEFASYFECRVSPKVLLLTVKKPSPKTVLLLNELNKCLPNSEFR